MYIIYYDIVSQPFSNIIITIDEDEDQHIEHLQGLLRRANIPFKPDKCSTLATVVNYVKQLQEQVAVLGSQLSSKNGRIMPSGSMVGNTTGGDAAAAVACSASSSGYPEIPPFVPTNYHWNPAISDSNNKQKNLIRECMTSFCG